MASEKFDGNISVLRPKHSMLKDWGSQKQSDLRLIYGLTLEQEPNVFREVKIFFNQNVSKFIVTSKEVDPAETAKKAKEDSKQDLRTPAASNAATPTQQRLNAALANKVKQQQQKDAANEIPYEPSPDIELSFVILKYREGFRYFQGVLIPGKNPIIFQVEQASAYARHG